MLFGKEHLDRYVATDGEEGYSWHEGSSILILTTKGRRSGQPRSAPLIFGRHGDDLLIVASRGGAPAHPAWYLNLDTNPEVEVQVKGDRFPAHARTATAAEKPELWKIMTAIWPHYDEYQQRTQRDIPVVVLEREAAA